MTNPRGPLGASTSALQVVTSAYSIESFQYELPAGLIAQEPLARRDAARLLVLDRATGGLRHRTAAELPAVLPPGSLLVVNRSRVFPARLLGPRPGRGAAEILLVRPERGLALAPAGSQRWLALLRPGRRLKTGDVIEIAPGFRAHVEGPDADRPQAGPGEGPTAASSSALRRVRLEADDGDCAAAVMRHGHVPLPPYIRRPDMPPDRDRYQTVYARETGSVAAPTAGLHFTTELLARLGERGVETAEVVLHVGPGTFRPVEVQDVRGHRVDPEAYSIPEATATAFARARTEGRCVVAVGTTTTRALETAIDEEGRLRPGTGETTLVIVPGFRFRAVDALLTNFHLPRSSLLLLVCAFGGRERVLAAYREAVHARYRFYSYGDAMLLV